MRITGANGAAVLNKALVLFKKVIADRGNTPLAVVARDMDLPSSTLYRLIAALESGEMICRVGRGRYDVGIGVIESLAGISAHELLVKIARPIINRLARQTRTTAHLGIWQDDMVTYLVKTTGHNAGSFLVFTREDTQLDAYCTGIGKVLLAHLSGSAQRAYVASSPFVALTSRTITDPAKLLSAFRQIRRRGYAVDDGETADDLNCIAVPLRYGRFGVAAISLASSRDESHLNPLKDHLPQLKACAADIRRRLGHRQ